MLTVFIKVVLSCHNLRIYHRDLSCYISDCTEYVIKTHAPSNSCVPEGWVVPAPPVDTTKYKRNFEQNPQDELNVYYSDLSCCVSDCIHAVSLTVLRKTHWCLSLIGWYTINAFICERKLLFFGRICNLPQTAISFRILIRRLCYKTFKFIIVIKSLCPLTKFILTNGIIH
jgi:hypothetical protein